MRFASRDTTNRKCTVLVNVGVMLKGLRPTGGDGRENTRRTANAEPQRRDSSMSFDRFLTWKKLSVFNHKQRVCRRKNRLSRSTPLPGLFGGWNGLETALSQTHRRKERSTKTAWPVSSNSTARQGRPARDSTQKCAHGLGM